MPTRPDTEQDAAVGGIYSRALVIAPPGTGKTALAARLAGRFASETSEIERVLLLTFSNQARGQLEREVESALALSVRRRVEVANYHQFFWSAVRAYRRVLGLPEDLRLSSSRRRHAILRGADQVAVDTLRGREYLLDGFAEQAIPEIAPATGLSQEQINRLLEAVQGEHERGHLVFDDLGALFFMLVNRFPAVKAAYARRYPYLVADEHQDSSAVQDALVWLLGDRRRVILADPMQLIHGWRGADEGRLNAHRAHCDCEYTLTTPHRWHGSPTVGQWLLGVRTRLTGGESNAQPPASFAISRTDPHHGENGMLAATRYAVLGHLAAGATSVAVLARTGPQVVRVRDYLSSQGLRPRQLGASDIFENGLALEEDLATLQGRALADRALDTVYRSVPTISNAVRNQVSNRLGQTGSRKTGSGGEARILLNSLDRLFLEGPSAFFSSVVEVCLQLTESAGHNLPRPDEFAVYQTVHRSQLGDIGAQLTLFNDRLGALSRVAQRVDRGILTMTVHQAKGREFDAIVLYDASSRTFRATDDDKKLFYVAITRGVARWTLIAPSGQESPLIGMLGVP